MTREDAIYEIRQLAVLSTNKNIERITEALNMAIEALTMQYGEWVNSVGKPIKDNHSVYCSICGEWSEYRSDFCPNCGAEMTDRKTEPRSSEKPNNCKTEPRKEQNFCGKCRYLYRDFKYGLSCYRLMDNEPCKFEYRKAENSSEKPNNCEPQYEMGIGTLKCDNCSEYGSFKCTKCDGEMYFKRLEPKDEPQTDCAWR